MKKLYTAKTKYTNTFYQLLLVMVLAIAPSHFLQAQVRVDFTPRSSVYTPNKTVYNVKGDFTMIGNTNLTLAAYDVDKINTGDMKYVDVDNNLNTLNSSSATLTFSNEQGANAECSNIIYAGLYWTGRAKADNTFTVTKEVPTGNIIQKRVTRNYKMYNQETIPNTNYTLTETIQGNLRIFTFISSANGNKVVFYYKNSAPQSLLVSVNDGPQENVATSTLSDTKVTLSSPYRIFQSSDYTLRVRGFEVTPNNANMARVDVTFVDDIPETTPVTKNFDKRKISIKGPSATSYTELTASANDIYYPSGIDGDMYSAYIDVTDYVKNNGRDGEYFIADMALTEGDGGEIGYYGGWGMVVVYDNPQMKWRDITVFDGHAYVAEGAKVSHTLDVSGFNAIQNGPVNVKLGVMAGEGDRGIAGDYFKILRQSDNTFESLSHGGNSATNFFNSSIQTEGLRNPNLINNTGLDISMFDLDNPNNSIITNNQTSTQFQYGSTQDTYVIFNITFAVDAYIPESEGILAITNIDNQPATAPYISQPGNEVEYSLEIRNKGTEAIENGKLVIPVPFTSEFVSGSIVYNQYHAGFVATTPYFDSNEGATGSIVWDITELPLDADINQLLAGLTFRLKTTEDCSILVNNNCAPKIVILGGSISGVGANSKIPYTLPLIQGYQEDGVCIGAPNTDPIEISIDAAQYIMDNCTNTTIQREFLYCDVDDNGIPVSEVEAQFPQGSIFSDSYPLTDSSIIYNFANPFPSNIGMATYYAIPPGNSGCSYIFTIDITEVNTSPTVTDIAYCLNETATALTAQASESNYKLLFYSDNNPATVGHVSLIPDTSVPGEFTYYVAEGPEFKCVNAVRTPILVTVHDELNITLENQKNNTCNQVDSGALDILVSGGTNSYRYLWEYNGQIVSGLNTANISGLADGSYTVVVEDQETHCSATSTFIITTEAAGEIAINAPGDIAVEGCTVEDITAGNLVTFPFSSTTVSITNSAFLTEGGTYKGDEIKSLSYIDTVSGTCSLTVTRTFTIVDECDQSANSIQIITIENNNGPQINAPKDITLECGDSTDPSLTGMAISSDSCGLPVNVSYEDVTADGSCEGTFIITRTWTAINECGQSTSDSQIITVKDTKGPTVVTAFDAEITINCDAIPEIPQLEFEDACSTNIDVIFNEISTASENPENYVVTRTWNVSDSCNNISVFTQIINVNNSKTAIATTDTELCNDDDFNFDLFTLLDGDFDKDGVWSVVAGNAKIDKNLFNPYGLELGTYTFMYSLTDDYCNSETLVNITLNDDCVVLPCGSEAVVISKAVTTYADGKNDFFTVKGVETCGFTMEVQIYNRWGALVYESNNYQNDWNGYSSKASIGGSNYVPTGTYYYIVNLKNSGLAPFSGPIYVATK